MAILANWSPLAALEAADFKQKPIEEVCQETSVWSGCLSKLRSTVYTSQHKSDLVPLARNF